MTAVRRDIAVDVLTGFLGAGKTTLLNRLLPEPGFRSAAVIVNEFGEVGLDHLLVEAVAGDLLVLTTGCLCCAARGDLLAALDGLMARRGALGFERVVIETTGIAEPGPILNAVLLGPALGGGVRLGGVLTVVSAVDGMATLDAHDEARRQVALADRLLVTKTDLAAVGCALEGRLASLNPGAPVADARAAAPDATLFAPGLARGLAAAGHRHHGADACIRSVVLDAGVIEAGHLAGFVAALQATCGAGLLRLKGLAALRHDPERPAVVQAVGHVLHPVTRLHGWPAGGHRTRLVAILDGTDPADVRVLWDGFFGGPGVDRPDAAALMRGGGPGLFD